MAISRAKGQQVNSFNFLGINTTENVTWTSYIPTLLKKKTQKQLYFSGKLKKAELSCQSLPNFYIEKIDSMLTGNITMFAVQRILKDYTHGSYSLFTPFCLPRDREVSSAAPSDRATAFILKMRLLKSSFALKSKRQGFSH